uniref:TlpA disulfide reductase family protein n=1 Tax=Roseihalotalea indica TaxID=2867963 RepID=A0AA49GLK5_9BACT|nr:TlpA disulfide reductase family protein [Tunicatimonas sp. TK19036]
MKKLVTLFFMLTSVVCFSQTFKSDTEKEMINRFNQYNQEKLADIPLMNVDSATKTLSDFNHKLKLLDFWATWCAACISHLPLQEEVYQRLKQKYQDSFEWINISVDKDTSAWKNFMVSKGKPGVNLIGHIDSILNIYHVKHYPTYVLVNQNNEVIGYETPSLDWGENMIEYMIYKGMEGVASGEVFDSMMVYLPEKDATVASEDFKEWMNTYYDEEWLKKNNSRSPQK